MPYVSYNFDIPNNLLYHGNYMYDVDELRGAISEAILDSFNSSFHCSLDDGDQTAITIDYSDYANKKRLNMFGRMKLRIDITREIKRVIERYIDNFCFSGFSKDNNFFENNEISLSRQCSSSNVIKTWQLKYREGRKEIDYYWEEV